MTGGRLEQGGSVTTGGSIAIMNLHAQVEGLAAGIKRLPADVGPHPQDPLFITRMVALIDLLELRGHVCGHIADYERAIELSDMLVQLTPRAGTALLARARALATLHRFADALFDLDAAAHLGMSQSEFASERVGILMGLGRHEEAEALVRNSEHVQDKSSLIGHRAIMLAERGQPAEADHLFEQARRTYRGTSPFPLAQMDFRRGVMWHDEGALDEAQSSYQNALKLIPQYTPVLGHLAEVEILLGKPQAAAARLRPLTATSDDPEYAGVLATALTSCGKNQEARMWRERAASRYDELVTQHPEAYLHHAAHFWLTEGDDPEIGRQFAIKNLGFSQTPRDYALYERAASACANRAGHSRSDMPVLCELDAASKSELG